MGIVLIVLHISICFILIAVILLQAGRGQGLTGSNFSSGGVQSLLGTRTADFLTKATSAAAILFLFTCIGLDILETRRSRSLFETRRPAVPVDVQQIQRALEKIKAEEAKKQPAAAPPTAKQQPVPSSVFTSSPAQKSPAKSS